MRVEPIYIADFYYWLKTHHCLKVYERNLKASGKDIEKLFKQNTKGKIESVLRQSFDWETSPEGRKFWKDCENALITDFMDRRIK